MPVLVTPTKALSLPAPLLQLVVNLSFSTTRTATENGCYCTVVCGSHPAHIPLQSSVIHEYLCARQYLVPYHTDGQMTPPPPRASLRYGVLDNREGGSKRRATPPTMKKSLDNLSQSHPLYVLVLCVFTACFFFFFFFLVPFIILALLSRSLPVGTQARGHTAGASPSPTPTTVRALFLSREPEFNIFFPRRLSLKFANSRYYSI